MIHPEFIEWMQLLRQAQHSFLEAQDAHAVHLELVERPGRRARDLCRQHRPGARLWLHAQDHAERGAQEVCRVVCRLLRHEVLKNLSPFVDGS